MINIGLHSTSTGAIIGQARELSSTSWSNHHTILDMITTGLRGDISKGPMRYDDQYRSSHHIARGNRSISLIRMEFNINSRRKLPYDFPVPKLDSTPKNLDGHIPHPKHRSKHWRDIFVSRRPPQNPNYA